MTLENNRTFISPHNQRISRPHSKRGLPTKDSYGFEYPTMSLLVDAVISQVDNEFPRCQYASRCLFDDIVWQQAIEALMNQDHSCRGRDMADNEKVLFNLVSARLINLQEFDEPHKWSTCSIRYSAVMVDRIWALFEAEHVRNDHLESDLQSLKGQVSLLNNCLLTVDRFSFDANKKVNTELEKDGVRLNHHRSCLNTLLSSRFLFVYPLCHQYTMILNQSRVKQKGQKAKEWY
ncbi:hypothetical protein BDM02DRAFT_3187147 [Thelephora ganbajun]|uniref:Uncharacterized protein n=1 Tax=Thelephora ganbajun TaxID=370292 RepID=A0ACB6ZF55_THEGA|nr:hypothetical protein BDM02DRAFT_3187147 [Thelephora ganbajun]